jgi:hypothetical protein
MDVSEENLEPMDPFAPRGLDTLFSDPNTYEKIAAVNGYGFLQIVKNFKGIMHHSDMSPEEQFVFQNDLCQYLFTIPGGKKDFSYEIAIKNPDFKMQMCFLGVIHQLHFIGTLMKQALKQEASADATGGKDASKKKIATKSLSEKTEEDEEKVYAVPTFRGKKVSAGSNDEKQAAQQKDAFVSKYKYTRDFTISTDLLRIITNDQLDAIIISIFKYLQNSAYSVQTLESIQGRLEAGSILGALGKSSEESATAPGTPGSASPERIRSEKAKIVEIASKEAIDFEQIENVIIQRGIDFLTVYAPSLRKEYTGKISSAVKIEDIDRSLQETYKKLQASKSPAQRVDIDREYNSIRDNILKYQRLKLKL